MTPERWNQIEALLDEALDLDPAGWEAFLNEACVGDPELRREVVALLQAEAEAPDFLEADAAAFVAPLLPELPRSRSIAVPGEIGQHLGPYRLVREIGHGGMSVVYLGERDDGQFKQAVAVKLLRHLGGDREERIRRFKAERQILASLQHPHIARVYDGGVTEGGWPYLVMAYIEGQPITEYCDDEQLGIEERLALFGAVCEAVQHAHQRFVVHRDLKPSNILVTREGIVKLLDFGIAKLLNEEEGAAVTQTGMRVMTPAYAAPEQVRGGTITTATDVYALGIMLYELLSGHRPYDVHGRSASDIENLICNHEPSRPSTAVQRARKTGTTSSVLPEAISEARATELEALQRRLRGDLDYIVLKALRKEPERRYASAEALLDDIRNHLAHQPVTARKGTLAYRSGKFIRRHAWPLSVVAGGLLLAAVFLMVYQMRVAEVVERENLARAEAQKAEQVAQLVNDLWASSDRLLAKEAFIGEMDAERARASLVEEGLARLEGEPDMQARMLIAMAGFFRNEDLLEEAWWLIEQAEEIGATLFQGIHPAEVALLEEKALLHFRVGNMAEADSVFRRTMTLRKGLFGETADLVFDLRTLSKVHFHDNSAEAERLTREALAVSDRIWGQDHLEYGMSLRHLASVLQHREHYAESEQHWRQALALYRRILGEEHIDVARDLRDLGWVVGVQQRYEEAEELLQEALALFRKTQGDLHPDIAYTLRDLAALSSEQEDHARTKSYFEQLIDQERQLYKPGRLDLAQDLTDYGRFLFGTGEVDAAEPLVREALSQMEEAEAVYFLPEVQRTLGQILTEQQHYEEAKTLLLAAHETLKSQLEDAQLTLVQKHLVELYTAWGKVEEAATYRALLNE